MATSNKKPKIPKVQYECICIKLDDHHSWDCKDHNRKRYLKEWQKNDRIKRRKDGDCIYPGCKCRGEREIVIHQYCKTHRRKAKENADKQKAARQAKQSQGETFRDESQS